MSEQEIRVGDTVTIVRCPVPTTGHEGLTGRVVGFSVEWPGHKCEATRVEFVSRPRPARELVEEIALVAHEYRGYVGFSRIADLAREALAALEQQP